ncbi:MAG: divalent-cation tolerance protein CutA [Planctomycetales bacterium]
MSASFVYITAASREQALALGRTLVEERLAACVNLLEGMTSVYRWQGKVEEAGETVLIAKTRTELVDALATRVRELHDYECPCVAAWPIVAGNAEYLRWIEEESGEDRGSRIED